MSEQPQWNADLYQDKHAFVWQYGSDLVTLLAPQPGEKILDLGCGTGQLTAKLAETGAMVMGIDNSPDMITQARENYPQLEFLVANGADFSLDKSFDAIFSNAALHWMKPPEAVIACISRALKPGGRFVAEFGGKGNVDIVLEAIASTLNREVNPWYFPSIGEYTTLLEKEGFLVREAYLFARPTALQGEEGMGDWLTMFASGILEGISQQKQADIIASIVEKLRPKLYRDGTWFLDYQRIRVVAYKLACVGT